MGFEPVEIVSKHNRPLQASVTYMRYSRKGVHKKGAKPQLIIALPTVIAAISKKKYFQFEIGKGGDQGKARITGQNVKNKATIEPKGMKHCVTFNFGFVPMFGEDIAGKEHVNVRKISDDIFEIDLPAWCAK